MYFFNPKRSDFMQDLTNDQDQTKTEELIKQIVANRDQETKKLADIFHIQEARVKMAETRLTKLNEQVRVKPDDQNLKTKC